jgi:hypothetical protein
VAVMDGDDVKSLVGWHLEARRRNEDNENGLWRWRSGLGSLLEGRGGRGEVAPGRRMAGNDGDSIPDHFGE